MMEYFSQLKTTLGCVVNQYLTEVQGRLSFLTSKEIAEIEKGFREISYSILGRLVEKHSVRVAVENYINKVFSSYRNFKGKIKTDQIWEKAIAKENLDAMLLLALSDSSVN